MRSRRKFLRDVSYMAGGAGFSYLSLKNKGWIEIKSKSGISSGMTLRYKPYELHLKHVFTLASGSRSTTPVMLTEIEYENINYSRSKATIY